MPEGHMRKSPRDGIAQCALSPAAAAPGVGLVHATLKHDFPGLESLPDRSQPEFIKVAESREIGGLEGSVVHVEVFRMGSVRTSIIGRPRPMFTAPHRGARLHPQLRRAPYAASRV